MLCWPPLLKSSADYSWFFYGPRQGSWCYSLLNLTSPWFLSSSFDSHSLSAQEVSSVPYSRVTLYQHGFLLCQVYQPDPQLLLGLFNVTQKTKRAQESSTLGLSNLLRLPILSDVAVVQTVDCKSHKQEAGRQEFSSSEEQSFKREKLAHFALLIFFLLLLLKIPSASERENFSSFS